MKTSDNRKVALLVLAAVSLSFIGLAGPVAGAQTLDITGLRISPNPGYACENTTISFNVTNNLGTMVDFASVSVAAKSSVGGMSWQSNISLFADGATSFQSFTWTYPAEGTYDVSISVFGAGQIAQKSGIYTVLPCAAHVYIGSVTIVKSAQAPSDGATVTVDVMNDGHAPAYNTTVAVQATGPHPDATRYFLGSTVIPEIAASNGTHPDFMWAPIPLPGVYTVSVMTIDENGVMMTKDVSLVVDLQTKPKTVHITGISLDPYPPMHGQESTVTAELMFTGNWTGVPVTVLAHADGPSSYKLYNITLKEVFVTGLMAVNFTWPADIEPGQYNLTVTALFNPREYTFSTIPVTQLAKQKQWLPANFRLELKGLRMSPYPPMPGQNATVMVEVANTGDADAPPAKLTVTAEGPAFYNLGTRTTPSTSFGTMVRMEFNWTQPIMPGEYTITAFLEDAGGNQSDIKRVFVLPHVLESNRSIVNGTNVYNYYYFGAAPNGSQGQNITVVVPATLNETEAASTGLDNPAVAGVAGVAAGGLVAVGSVLAYGLAKRRGQMTDVQSNPMYKENANKGQNPIFQDKGMAGENPLYIHERMVHGVHAGEGVAEPPEASLVGGALPGGAVISAAASSAGRESPTLPSTGSPSEARSKVAAVGRVETPLGLQGSRESPTRASTGVVTAREAGSGMATGRRQYVPHGVTDADGDAGSDARMAINEKGLPGKKKPSTQRLAGDGIEPVDPDDDGDSVPDVQGMAINEKGLPGDKKPKKTSSQARTAGGEPLDDDSDDDGLSDADERKGWDGTVKGTTMADETPEGPQSVKPISGVGIVVKSNSGASSSGERKGWDGTIKGGKVDEDGSEAASRKGYEYYQAKSDMSAGRATRASAAGATNDNVSSIAQTAGSSPGVPESNQGRKGWDGTVKGVTSGESAAGRDAAHPVISKLRESPTKASGLRESPTGSDFAIKEQGVKSSLAPPPDGEPMGIRESPTRASGLRESPTLASTGQTALRESPTKASLGQTAVRESPTRASGLRESPTLASTGQTALRESPTKASTGQTSIRESPTRSDYAIKEQGVKSSQAAPPAGDLDGDGSPDRAMKEEGGRHTPFHNKAQEAQDYNSSRSNKTASSAAPDGGEGTGSGGTGPDGKLTAAELEAQKHTKTGHVTLMK